MDLVAHLYGQLSRDGYRGVPLMGMYRDEVGGHVSVQPAWHTVVIVPYYGMLSRTTHLTTVTLPTVTYPSALSL
jgi:hypothetical protein